MTRVLYNVHISILDISITCTTVEIPETDLRKGNKYANGFDLFFYL